MSSVEGSQSFQAPSDETFEYECGPCKYEGQTGEAKHYCEVCTEYLCNDCRSHHKKFREMRDHKILSGSMMPRHRHVEKSTIPGVQCSCSTNLVEIYCEDHDDIICGPCKTVKHRRCKTQSVKDKITKSSTSYQRAVFQKATSLRTRLEDLKLEKQLEKKSVSTANEKCKTEIKEFRKNLDTMLDDIEQDILNEFGRIEHQRNQSITRNITTVETTSQMLQADDRILEDAEKADNKEISFASCVKVAKNLNEYETVLLDIEKESPQLAPVFERNPRLENLLIEMPVLGTLKMKGDNQTVKAEAASKYQSDPPIMTDMEIKSSRTVKVKLSEDETTPNISGCSFMPNGQLLLLDRNNRKVKLLDSAFTLQVNLGFETMPWDIAVVDDNSAIFTLPYFKTLQYIHLTPSFSTGRSVTVKDNCFGVSVAGEELFVSCYQHSSYDIRVLDVHGNEKYRIGYDKDGFHLLSLPYYLAANPSRQELYVSDWDSCSVYCLSFQGPILYQYKDENLKNPCGFYIDAADNVVVAAEGSNYVQIISKRGSKCKMLVSTKDGIVKPRGIAYRPSDNTLVVGCANNDNLFMFKLA